MLPDIATTFDGDGLNIYIRSIQAKLYFVKNKLTRGEAERKHDYSTNSSKIHCIGTLRRTIT